MVFAATAGKWANIASLPRRICFYVLACDVTPPYKFYFLFVFIDYK
jgi:hypothetical protein